MVALGRMGRLGGYTMLVQKTSILSNKTTEMDLPITQEQIDHWQESGLLIQDAFPQLSAEQREFLITGITPTEWNATFGSWDPENDPMEM